MYARARVFLGLPSMQQAEQHRASAYEEAGSEWLAAVDNDIYAAPASSQGGPGDYDDLDAFVLGAVERPDDPCSVPPTQNASAVDYQPVPAAGDSYAVAQALNPQHQPTITLPERMCNRDHAGINLNVAGVAGHPDRNQDEDGCVTKHLPVTNKGDGNQTYVSLDGNQQTYDGVGRQPGNHASLDGNQRAYSFDSKCTHNSLHKSGSGQRCNRRALLGSPHCDAHTCTAAGCTAGKSSQTSHCATHVYNATCSYRSPTGKICKNGRSTGSTQCANHTCSRPGCVGPKSSRGKHCAQHAAGRPGVTDDAPDDYVVLA